MMIDLATEFGQRVARRLKEEHIVWLTTVGPDGIPQPRPVWFLWDGETFLIYSQPDTYKLRHIARNPKVALNLDSDGRGGDIVVFTGEVSIDSDAPPANEMVAYADKYQEGIAGIGMSPEKFAKSYSVALRVKPISLRGH
jgi:PPOX class probable F420-dependent enzyme